MISVCMATYNGARFIKEQLNSILSQISANDEVIISDDGSTDGTLEIIMGYNDSRIRLFHHISNNAFSNHEKTAANFENALMQAKGDYIFLSDQDDIWLRNKVAVCMEYLKKFDFIVHGKTYIDGYNHILAINDSKFEKIPNNWFFLAMHMTLYGCCYAFSRKILDIALPFPDKVVGHDHWLSVISVRFYSVFFVKEPLILYRLHSDSVSHGKSLSFFEKVSYRIKLFHMLRERFRLVEAHK